MYDDAFLALVLNIYKKYFLFSLIILQPFASYPGKGIIGLQKITIENKLQQQQHNIK